MALKLSIDAKLYLGVTELTNVKDVTLSLEADQADVTTRGGGGFKWTMATLIDASIEFQMLWDTTDANFTAIQEAYFGRTALDVAALDGDIDTAGSQGVKGDFAVVSFTRNEMLAEALTVDVTLKPTYSADNPVSWHTVADTVADT